MSTTTDTTPEPVPVAPASPDARPQDAAARHWLQAQINPYRPVIHRLTALGIAQGLLVIPQAGLIAALIAGLLIPAALTEHINAAALPDQLSGDWLPRWGLPALLAVIVARTAIGWWRQRIAADLARQLRAATRQQVATHVYALGPIGIARLQGGQLASALLEQIDALAPYATRYLPQALLAVCVPLGLLIMLFLLDWLIALIVLLAAPLVPISMAVIGRGAAGVSRAQFQALARLGNQFLDRLQGLAVLKHHGHGDAAADAIARAADDYRERTMSVLRVAFLSSAALELISAMAIAMVALTIGSALLGVPLLGSSQSLTVFSGLFMLLLVPDVFQPLRELGQHYHDRAAALGAAAALQPLLATPVGMAQRTGTRPAPTAPPVIHYQGVNVCYRDQRPILPTVLNWTAPGGRTSLLVGPSGSGKSTLLGLVAGFIDCSQGRLLIDGHPTAEYAPGSLEQRMAWLGQNPLLLPGSLRENLLLADPHASEQQLLDAARRAGVLQFAHGLPDGLDTRVGERGYGLSGGEAQRVALARALLRRPCLLLLDEPTARLDPESRDWVLTALREVADNQCTVLIATHQPDWFDWAEQRLTLGGQAHD